MAEGRRTAVAVPGRRLIVNADDYGKSPKANDAIRQAVRGGLVTSTTVMVNMPQAVEIADLARECPRLSVGLHLNLTEGAPVSPPESVASLVDATGGFWPMREFLWRAWLGRIRAEHLRAEIDAQIAALQRLVSAVSHLDSHKHVHSRSLAVLREMLPVAAARGIRRLRSNRRRFVASAERPEAGWRLRFRHLRRSPLGAPGMVLTAIQTRWLRDRGFASPDAILTPFPPIPNGPLGAARGGWSRAVSHMPAGTFETIFHPGGGPQYEGQVDLLCDAELRAATREAGIELSSYTAVGPP
jgi:hypothetical protein